MSSLCGRLRALVHDCLQKQLHDAGVFYADKLVTFSHGKPCDVLLLAQAYISSKQHRRALQALKKDSLIETDARFRYLAACCLLHCKQWDECLALIGEDSDILALGHASSWNTLDAPAVGCEVSVIASLHLLRARAYEGLNNRLRAKDSYQAALAADPYCYDAFTALFEGHMLTCDEEAALLDQLQLHPQDHWLRLLLTAQGNKYGLNLDMDALLNTLDSPCQLQDAPQQCATTAQGSTACAAQPVDTAHVWVSQQGQGQPVERQSGLAAPLPASAAAQPATHSTPLLFKSVPLNSNRAQQALSPAKAAAGKAGAGKPNGADTGAFRDSDVIAASNDQEAAQQVASWSTYLTHLTSGVITPSSHIHPGQSDALMVTPDMQISTPMSDNGTSVTDMDAETPGYGTTNLPPTVLQQHVITPHHTSSPPAPIRFSLLQPDNSPAPPRHPAPAAAPAHHTADCISTKRRAPSCDQHPGVQQQQQSAAAVPGGQQQPELHPSASGGVSDVGRRGLGLGCAVQGVDPGQASTQQQQAVVSGGLQGNMDLLACRADWLFHRGMYDASYELTAKVLRSDAYALQVLPLHIACCCVLSKQAELFQLGHRLTEQFPDKALSWYAVGCYYMCSRQYDQARRHLSKATSLQGGFAPAWLAYGHAFSALGERDQSMAAYRMAFRLFPGLHLPLLGMGMEYAAMNNLQLAERMLLAAHELCPSDPATCHELGCVAARNGMQPAASAWLRHALKLAVQQHAGVAVQQVEAGDQELVRQLGPRWEPAMVALAHSLRKQGQVEEAVQWYRLALSVVPSHPGTMSALGLCLQMQNNAQEAVEMYHAAMALRPDDQLVATLLNTALMEYTAEDDLGIGSAEGTSM